MYCLVCGSNLPEDAPFCLNCGRLAPQKMRHDPTQVVSSLSDPYGPRPATSYGPPEGPRQNPYVPQNPHMPPAPPPPPRRRRILPAILISTLVLLLLSIGLSTLFLLKQETPSQSIASTVTPAATLQSTPIATPTVSTSPTANTTSQSLPGIWTPCAVENATCQFSGTVTVAFGANGSYTYATKTNGTACTIDAFGDPLHKVQKACYREVAPPVTNIWTQCATENATCQFSGTMTVAFGANGSYTYATKTNGTACTIDAFGDPLHKVQKACYLISSPPGTAAWQTCATENGTCSFTGKHEVAYGANGQYLYGNFRNGTTCANSVFGDPAPGTMKSCYYQ